MANITDATNAYSNALTQLNKGLGAGQASGTTDTAGNLFGDLVKQGLQNVVETQHKSEAVSAKALADKADMTDVVQAVTEAEMQLNTVIALRDKIISAYDSVMRTQI